MAAISAGDDPRIMFGDRLYICFTAVSTQSESRVEGIVCALADGCFLRTTKPALPDSESRSFWTLTPRLNFDANELLLREQNKSRFVQLGSDLAQDAARERKENDEAESKVLGTPIAYGQIVLLKDVVGSEYLAMRRPDAGDAASPVRLTSGESAAYFKIMPGSRARAEGDPVHERDTVLMVHVDTQLNLAADTTEEIPFNVDPDAPGYVVTGSRDRCYWIINRAGTGGVPSVLQSGDTVQWCHREHNGLMSLHVLPSARATLPFRFETYRQTAPGLGIINMTPFYSATVSAPFARMVSMRDMQKYKENRPGEYWTVERVRGGGGPIKYHESVYVKHVMTGLYLAVHPDDIGIVRRKEAEMAEAEGRPIGMQALGKGIQDVTRLLGSGFTNVNKFLGDGLETMAGEALAKKGVLRLFGRSKPKEEEKSEEEEEEIVTERRIPKAIPTVVVEKEKELPIRLYLSDDRDDTTTHWRFTPSDRSLTRQSVVSTEHVIIIQHCISRYYVHMGQPFSFDQVVPPPVVPEVETEKHSEGFFTTLGGTVPTIPTAPPPRPVVQPVKRRPDINEGTCVVELRHFPAVDDIWSVKKVEPHWLATIHTMAHYLKGVRLESHAPTRPGAPPEEDPIDFDAIAYYLDELVDTVFPWADRRALRPDLDFEGDRAQAHLRGARFINKTRKWTQDAAVSAGLLDVCIELLYRIRPHGASVRRSVTSLTFVLLGALCTDNEGAAVLVRPHMPIILYYSGDVPRTGAVSLLTSMYSASQLLTLGLGAKDVPVLVELCSKKELAPAVPQFYALLTSLCKWDGKPCVRNQNLIGSAMFEGEYKKALTWRYEPGDASAVVLVSGSGKKSDDVIKMVTESQRQRGGVGRRIDAAAHLGYLELMCALSGGRHVGHQRVVQERFPLYLLSYILRQDGVPVQLKCTLLDLIRVVHIETVERSQFQVRCLRFYPHMSLLEDSLAPTRRSDDDDDDDQPAPPGFDSIDIFRVFELMMNEMESFCEHAEGHRLEEVVEPKYVYMLAVIKQIHMMGLAGQFHLLTSVEIGRLLLSCRRLLLLQPPSAHIPKAGLARRHVASIQIETCRLITHLQDRAMDARLTMLWGLFCQFVESGRIQEADVYDSVMDRFLNRIMTVGEEAGAGIIFVRLLQGSDEFLVNYHALKFVLAGSRVWRNVLREFERMDFLVGDDTAEAYKQMRDVGHRLGQLMAQGIEETLDEIDTVLVRLLTDMLEGCTARAPEGQSPTLLEKTFVVGDVLVERQRIMAAVDLQSHLIKLLITQYQPQYKGLFKVVYKILYGFAVGNNTNLLVLRQELPTFLSHIPLEVGAVEIVTLLLGSRKVVSQLTVTDVDSFIESILRHGQQPRLIRLVSMLCATPLPKLRHAFHAHQVRVIEHLRESHDELFPPLINGEPRDVRLKTYYRAGQQTPHANQLQAHIAFVELLASLSAHRNVDAQGYSRNYITAQECIEVLKDDEAPLNMKSAYLAYLHHVFVDSDLTDVSEDAMESLVSVFDWASTVIEKLIKSYSSYENEAAEGVAEAGIVVSRGGEVLTVTEYAELFKLVIEDIIPLCRSLVSHAFFTSQPPKAGGLMGVAQAARRRSGSAGKVQAGGLGALAVQALTTGFGSDVEKHVRHSARREQRGRSLSIASSIGSEPESVISRRSSVKRASVKFSPAESSTAVGLTNESSNVMRGSLNNAYALLKKLMDLILRASGKMDLSSDAPQWRRLVGYSDIDAVVDFVDDLQDNPWLNLSRDDLMPRHMFLTWFDDHYAERSLTSLSPAMPSSPMMIGAGAALSADDEEVRDDAPLLDDGQESVPMRPIVPRMADEDANSHVFIHRKFAAYRQALGKFFGRYVEEEDRLLNSTLERLADDSLRKMIVQATIRPPWPTPPLNDIGFILFVLHSLQHIIKSSDEVRISAQIRVKITKLGGTVRVLRLAASDSTVLTTTALQTLELLLEGGSRDVQEAVLREAEVAAGSMAEWSFYGELDSPLSHAVTRLAQGEKVVAAPGGHGASTKAASVFVREAEEEQQVTHVAGLDDKSRASLRLCLRIMLLLSEGGFDKAQDALREGIGTNLVTRLVQLIEVLAPPIRAGLRKNTAAELSQVVVDDFVLVLDTLVNVISGPCAANQVLVIHSAALETLSELLAIRLFWSSAEGHDETIELVVNERSVAQRRVVVAIVKVLLSLLEGVKCNEHIQVLNRKPFRENLARVAGTYYTAITATDKKSKKDPELAKTVLAEGMQIWIIFVHLSDDSTLSWRARDMRDILKEQRQMYMSYLGQVEVLRENHLERVLFQKPSLSRSYMSGHDKNEIAWTVNRATVADKVSDFDTKAEDTYTELCHRRVVKQSLWRRWLTNPTVVTGLDYTADFLTVIINVMLVVSSAVPSVQANMLIVTIILGAVQLTCFTLVNVSGFVLKYKLKMDTRYRHYLERVARKKGEIDDTETDVAKLSRRIARTLGLHRQGRVRSFFIQLWYFFTTEVLFKLTLILFGVLALVPGGDIHFFGWHILNILAKSPLLINVVRSVTKNGKSILLTALLGLVVIYWYSIFAYMYLGKLFVKDYEDRDNSPTVCTNIFTCWVAILAQFPSGGDYLRERMFFSESGVLEGGPLVFQLTFFFIVIVIIMSVLFGIIVDTFAELRNKRQAIKSDMVAKCFICDIESQVFDREGEGFERHIDRDHPMFGYIHYRSYLKEQVAAGVRLYGVDAWMHAQLCARSNAFYPVSRSMVLDRCRAERRVKPPKTDFSGELIKLTRELEKMGEWMTSLDRGLKTHDTMLQSLVVQTQPVEPDEDESPTQHKATPKGAAALPPPVLQPVSMADGARRRREAQRKKAADKQLKLW